MAGMLLAVAINTLLFIQYGAPLVVQTSDPGPEDPRESGPPEEHPDDEVSPWQVSMPATRDERLGERKRPRTLDRDNRLPAFASALIGSISQAVGLARTALWSGQSPALRLKRCAQPIRPHAPPQIS